MPDNYSGSAPANKTTGMGRQYMRDRTRLYFTMRCFGKPHGDFSNHVMKSTEGNGRLM